MSWPNLVSIFHLLGEHTTPATTTSWPSLVRFITMRSSATSNAASTNASTPRDRMVEPANVATSSAASSATFSPPCKNATTSFLRLSKSLCFIAIVGSVSLSLGNHCCVSSGRVPTRWRNSFVNSVGNIDSGMGNARKDPTSPEGNSSNGVNGC